MHTSDGNRVTLPSDPTLYPPIEPYMVSRLDVGDGHSLYFEQCGNVAGKPVIVLHGGPGGGCSPLMRRFHDPSRYRIILFDQRGCGRSTPHASIDANTTWHLVDDIEALRQRLDLGPVQVFGGSWGSTLALAYAISYPENVTDLILRGIFLLRQREIDWFYRDGCGWLFPEAFETFRNHIPHDERDDLIAAYHRRLTSDDLDEQLAAAKAWSVWEGATLSVKPSEARMRAFAATHYARAFARIECHYFINRGFLSRDDYITANIDRIRHLPCRIVHGRFDVITPARNAWDLKTVWPEADLRIVAGAGHAMSEPGITSELVKATRAAAVA
ncbi:MAG: prolyl aminopeptidase [Pseudomonadota bacterium]